MHSLTEMGPSEVSPGFLEPFRYSRFGPVWDWFGPGKRSRSENRPSSEIPGLENLRPPNKYGIVLYFQIYINIGFYVHRNIVVDES